MAKSLGQIHNVNFRAGSFTAINQSYFMDLPGQLTAQLQRMVRAGTFHKVVGIDMNLDPAGVNPGDSASISGRIRYFTPTRGRCEAFRSAFRAAANLMKSQGVSMRDNKMYDFRAPLNSTNPLAGNDFQNQATLDGTDGLALVHNTAPGASIFGVHNAGVQPVSTTASADVFTPGFGTILQGAGGTDFVLNDTLPFTGNPMEASEEYEEIPFELAYNPASANASSTATGFSFRPDPALYLAVLCGQFQIVIDEISLSAGVPSVVINCSVQVAGWKSIMGSPDKKKSSRRKKAMKPAAKK
jgi:hypothetical protein